MVGYAYRHNHARPSPTTTYPKGEMLATDHSPCSAEAPPTSKCKMGKRRDMRGMGAFAKPKGKARCAGQARKKAAASKTGRGMVEGKALREEKEESMMEGRGETHLACTLMSTQPSQPMPCHAMPCLVSCLFSLSVFTVCPSLKFSLIGREEEERERRCRHAWQACARAKVAGRRLGHDETPTPTAPSS